MGADRRDLEVEQHQRAPESLLSLGMRREHARVGARGMELCRSFLAISLVVFWLRVPQGLEDVSKYPDLIAELLRRKWTEEEVKDALANNLLRVLQEVEQVRPLRPEEELEVDNKRLGHGRTSAL